MNGTVTVRVGIIGLGVMGSSHARNIIEGNVPGLELSAVSDANEDRWKPFPDQKHFSDGFALIQSGEIDAVLIATPHYSHTVLGIAALEAGLHTLVEKPISVHKADCERLISAWTDKRIVFSAMFNQRTDPFYRKLRELIQTGELGEIRRVNWIITDWYRPEHYYASGNWRATWKGEGGGVLLNQSPHNLDLLQWLFGMPSRLSANCQFGRFHQIEVEDAVTALLEYPNGATGVFITTTGEAPGTNRLEVAGDNGKVVIENDSFTFYKTEMPVSEHSRTATGAFDQPTVEEIVFPIEGHGDQHLGILKNFSNAILEGETLLSPAPEGMNSVELANAMLYSSFTNKPVDLPLDAAAYEAALKQRIAESTFVKPETVNGEVADPSGSFGH